MLGISVSDENGFRKDLKETISPKIRNFFNIIFFLTLSTIYKDIQSKADTNFSDLLLHDNYIISDRGKHSLESTYF